MYRKQYVIINVDYRCNTPVTGQKFCIGLTVVKQMGRRGDSASDTYRLSESLWPVGTHALYNTLNEDDVPLLLYGLIKLC